MTKRVRNNKIVLYEHGDLVSEVQSCSSSAALSSSSRDDQHDETLPDSSSCSSTSSQEEQEEESEAMIRSSSRHSPVLLSSFKKLEEQEEDHHDSLSSSPSSGGADCRRRPASCSVSFGSVQVREYERILDHGGNFLEKQCALNLGWRYRDCGEPQRLDPFFCPRRCSSKPTFCGFSSGEERIYLLTEYGFTCREILEAEKERLANNKAFMKTNINNWTASTNGSDDEASTSSTSCTSKDSMVPAIARVQYRGKVAGWILSGLARRGREFILQRAGRGEGSRANSAATATSAPA